MTNNYTEEFYDQFADSQSKSGINHRHLAIQRWLERFKLPKSGNILEIGCGIGTQTQLILEYLNLNARVTATDISGRSISLAKQRLQKYENVTFITGDALNLELSEKFDAIILPDVIEHIPIQEHYSLFQKLSTLLDDDGFIFIHIPNPNYLEWITSNEPEKLQIIDNPVYTDVLLNVVYQFGLYLEFLESYSIFASPSDYQILLLKKKRYLDYSSINNPKGNSIIRRLVKKLKLLVRGI